MPSANTSVAKTLPEAPAYAKHDPIAYSIKDACRVSSIGKTRLYQLISEQKLQARKIGKRTLIPAESLHRLIAEGC